MTTTEDAVRGASRATASRMTTRAIAGRAGRMLYGLPMIVFGIQHFIFADFVVTLMQPWLPWRPFWTWFCGVALAAAGVAITAGRVTRLAATLLGVMIFLFFLLVHIPLVIAQPGDPHQWTYLTQAFTFSGIALLIAAATANGEPGIGRRWLPQARWMVAAGFLILGVRQLLGVPFVLGLVPAWPPGQAVWAGLAGVLLAATSLGIALRRPTPPALLLGGLLLLFLLAFHVPGLVRDARRGDWGAACKDAILCGGALVVAGLRRDAGADPRRRA